MHAYTLSLRGLEARLWLSRNRVTGDYGVSGLLFDEFGATVAEYSGPPCYSGFCAGCALYESALSLFGYRRGIEACEIAEQVQRAVPGWCSCDE